MSRVRQIPSRPHPQGSRMPTTVTKTNQQSAIRNPKLLRRSLVAWFRKAARDLPWRRTRDPYAILVSEIMLQQTQVATVIPYYERWLSRFPSFAALAAADESDVLSVWQGLGYYSRARNLHRAAKQVVTARARPRRIAPQKDAVPENRASLRALRMDCPPRTHPPRTPDRPPLARPVETPRARRCTRRRASVHPRLPVHAPPHHAQRLQA